MDGDGGGATGGAGGVAVPRTCCMQQMHAVSHIITVSILHFKCTELIALGF